MKIKSLILFISLSLLILFSGCFNAGSFLAHNATNVELSESNFKIMARNVQGSSTAGYLIGVSFSTGFTASTLALFRVSGSVKLYDDALKDLWKNYEANHGETEGKKLLLTNVRYDTDILNLFVYTQTELFITADVIEFTE